MHSFAQGNTKLTNQNALFVQPNLSSAVCKSRRS